MDKRFYDSQQRSARLWTLFLGGLLVLSVVGNVLQTVRQATPLTVMIPSRVSGTYEITRAYFDDRWLADAATDVAYLWFNVSPVVTQFRQEQILRWVHPSSQQAISEQIAVESANIRKNKMSMALIIHAVRIAALDEERARVEVDARLRRWIVGRTLAQESITIVLSFARDARGAPQITSLSWKESKP